MLNRCDILNLYIKHIFARRTIHVKTNVLVNHRVAMPMITSVSHRLGARSLVKIVNGRSVSPAWPIMQSVSLSQKRPLLHTSSLSEMVSFKDAIERISSVLRQLDHVDQPSQLSMDSTL